jgi:putative NIF3 family GTP cyclohydrolase 1 type 2
LTIWRFHDYWHRRKPDGIRTGIVKALDWEAYQQAENEALLVIPQMTVAALAATVKERLGLSTLRLVGDLQQRCERIALLLGAVGGERQIKAFHQWDADVVLCGETSE